MWCTCCGKKGYKYGKELQKAKEAQQGRFGEKVVWRSIRDVIKDCAWLDP